MRLITILLALWTAVPALSKPERLEPRAGEGIYLIVLGDRAKEPDVAAHGGRVLRSWSDRRIVAIPEERLDVLKQHEGVVYVQRIWTGSSSQGAVVPEPAVMSTGTPPSWSTGTFEYDPSGNIKKIGSDTFGYDTVARVIQANVKGTPQVYNYDVYGNLEQLGGTDLTVDSSNNRLGGFVYDSAGNVKRDHAGRNYHYDALGMVMAIETTVADTIGHDLRMVYTADDERIVIQEGTATERYRFRDLQQRLLREWKSTGDVLEWERDYLYAGNDLVGGEVQIDQRQNGQRHYHTDQLGSVRLVTDGAGSLVAHHDYMPFGAEIPPTISEWTNTNKAPRDPRKFTGHERDYFSVANVEGDVIDYMHARYYGPNWGRFLSVDPVLEVDKALKGPQRWNRYSYVINNPTRYTDPTGKVVLSGDEVRDEVKKRKLQQKQAELAAYAKQLAQSVQKGMDSKLAMNLYWSKASSLTAPKTSGGAKPSAEAVAKGKEDALLIATGAALQGDVRGSRNNVGDSITRGSMGEDTLHHFFINAVNTFDWMPVGTQQWLANTARGETDVRDIKANNAGAVFGERLKRDPNIQPSSVLE